MSEAEAIAAVTAPQTTETLAQDLAALGLRAGDKVLVHSSLSSLGWVCGGAVAVLQALEAVLTPAGTLVMPTHSGDLSDPQQWAHPPVPESWWATIRDTMPVFDAALTPTRGMGSLPETFRRQRGVVRGRHPQLSFAAWGRHRHAIVGRHPWHWPLGPDSPLGHLRALGGRVLLLGVGYDCNTSLHLAETLAHWPGRRVVQESAPWKRVAGRTLWKPVENVAFQDEDFCELGAAFEAAGRVQTGRVGRAEARLMDQDALVTFAVKWMEAHRG